MPDEVAAPCQIPVKNAVTGETRICGVVKPSLSSHIKAHKKNGKAWTAKEYRKRFPEFSLGKAPYSPPPEQTQKLMIAGAKYRGDEEAAKAILENGPPKKRSNFDGGGDSLVASAKYDERIQDRFEELWAQVNRDVPARQFAMEAARAEMRMEDINKRYDGAFARGDYKRMNELMPQLQVQQKMLKDCMDFLDLTVKNRREKNQLGNDTVAQLVSNFGGTLRRWSPEKQQTFANRVNEVRRVQAERIRQKLLSEILEENIEEVIEQVPMTEVDYDTEIQKYVERALK